MTLETRDLVTISVVGLFGLLTLMIFILINWTICCSKSAEHISPSLKIGSFIACGSGLIMVIIDVFAILLSMKGLDLTDSIMINFVLPFSSFILKIFVYFIFIGQFYALKHNDLIYKTSRKVIIFIYVLIIISIICVLFIIILEPMIAFNVRNTDILQKIYKWDFVALNINEFILSLFVIYIFLMKLVLAMRFEKIKSYSMDDAFIMNNNSVRFVEDDLNLSYNDNDDNNNNNNTTKGGKDWLLNDHYEYNQNNNNNNNKNKNKKKPLSIKETSNVHIMIRLVLLSIFCIFSVELLFITLLNERFIDINYGSNIFEIVRCIESFCALIACLCIYLHFASNFNVYDYLCRCCHNCCLKMCIKCIAGKYNNNIIGDWNVDEDDNDNDDAYRQMHL